MHFEATLNCIVLFEFAVLLTALQRCRTAELHGKVATSGQGCSIALDKSELFFPGLLKNLLEI